MYWRCCSAYCHYCVHGELGSCGLKDCKNIAWATHTCKLLYKYLYLFHWHMEPRTDWEAWTPSLSMHTVHCLPVGSSKRIRGDVPLKSQLPMPTCVILVWKLGAALFITHWSTLFWCQRVWPPSSQHLSQSSCVHSFREIIAAVLARSAKWLSRQCLAWLWVYMYNRYIYRAYVHITTKHTRAQKTCWRMHAYVYHALVLLSFNL